MCTVFHHTSHPHCWSVCAFIIILLNTFTYITPPPLFMYMQSVDPPFFDDDAWIGVETLESKKIFFRLEIVMSHSDIVLLS